ncbi:MAG: redoxin domain-containing protein [Deltaproteobacteria bacterium]|nr:redoxin domain-containing protein [Deltaproteobacteria bacterium]
MDALRRMVGVLLVLAASSVARAAGPAVVPPTLQDVTGAPVDVARLAAGGRLVFVTVKAAWCPVCREQLRRLGRALPRLRACGATFVVLVPGVPAAVAAFARDTSFPYPFVADRARTVAAVAGFAGDAGRLLPGFFTVDAARAVTWTQRGRAGGAFGDAELAVHLGCPGAPPDLLARRPRAGRVSAGGPRGPSSAPRLSARRRGASRARAPAASLRSAPACRSRA